MRIIIGKPTKESNDLISVSDSRTMYYGLCPSYRTVLSGLLPREAVTILDCLNKWSTAVQCFRPTTARHRNKGMGTTFPMTALPHFLHHGLLACEYKCPSCYRVLSSWTIYVSFLITGEKKFAQFTAQDVDIEVTSAWKHNQLYGWTCSQLDVGLFAFTIAWKSFLNSNNWRNCLCTPESQCVICLSFLFC